MTTIQRLTQTLSRTRISTRTSYNLSQNLSSSSTCRSEQTTEKSPVSGSSTSEPNTHYKITLLRSAISLGERKKATLKTLGIHRRMQTVYHPHSPEFAGKILAVKELLKVENVPASAVRTKTEQRRERKASRGYVVVGRLNGSELETPESENFRSFAGKSQVCLVP